MWEKFMDRKLKLFVTWDRSLVIIDEEHEWWTQDWKTFERNYNNIQPLGKILTSVPHLGSHDLVAKSCTTDLGSAAPN